MRSGGRRWARWWPVAGACALLACSGDIIPGEGAKTPGAQGAKGANGPGGAGTATPGSTAGAGGNGAADGPGAGSSANMLPGGEEAADELPAPTTRAARLTHAQWQRSVIDLLHLDADQKLADVLRADPKQSGFLFDDNALTMVVDQALQSGYERAAAQVAELVTGDPARLAKVVPPDGGDAKQREADFISELGLRAHRRPLTSAEQAEYAALFEMGPSLYSGLDAFVAGVRVTIEAMLQSPYFLYRIEESDEPPVGDRIPLNSYELASRLSYTLWGTMPDDALFEAAAADSLRDPDQLVLQARRMIGDARAKPVVEDFHEQLFEVEKLAAVSPSRAFFPDAPATLGESAATELRMFVDDMVLDSKGSYADMLTSTETFVNSDLAEVYGLSGTFGSAFAKASLDASQRRGILTQVGFLAGHATSVNPDPIHRGVFIARRITCAQIAAPPANIPALPTPPAGQTNRKTIEDLTQDPSTICSTCHAAIINPFGFPFESFDAIGGYRTEDANQPVDTHTSPLIGGEPTDVADALELAEALAKSSAVHECYTRHWLEYAYGRPLAEQDAPLIERLSGRSLGENAPVEDLIVGLVTSPAFVTRSVEELP